MFAHLRKLICLKLTHIWKLTQCRMSNYKRMLTVSRKLAHCMKLTHCKMLTHNSKLTCRRLTRSWKLARCKHVTPGRELSCCRMLIHRRKLTDCRDLDLDSLHSKMLQNIAIHPFRVSWIQYQSYNEGGLFVILFCFQTGEALTKYSQLLNVPKSQMELVVMALIHNPLID